MVIPTLAAHWTWHWERHCALLALHVTPLLRYVGIEALKMSYELALMNIELNGLKDRFAVHHGDIRDRAVGTFGAL